MADDLLAEKAVVIQRCLERIREKYDNDPAAFLVDQDVRTLPC